MPKRSRYTESHHVRIEPEVDALLRERAEALSKKMGRTVPVPEVIRRIISWYLREKAEPRSVLKRISPRGRAVALDQVITSKTKDKRQIDRELLGDGLQHIALGAIRRGVKAAESGQLPPAEVASEDAGLSDEEAGEGDSEGE